jgi:hypothetical protein
MKEPIIIMPLSQYEEWKDLVEKAKLKGGEVYTAVMSSASPVMYKYHDNILTKDSHDEALKEIARKTVEKLGL